jgi:hypothetical protein
VASAAAFLVALGPVEGRVVDLGSGGGVPGLLLAAWLPEVSWVLLDQHRRRTSFLARTVAGLGWTDRVQVVRGPAEELAHTPEYRSQASAVVARSFGPPAATAEIAAGFLRVGGRLLVAEPPEPDEQRWPATPLRSLGMRRMSAPGAAVAVLELATEVASDRPRPWRELQRRPAWVVSRETSAQGKAQGNKPVV